MSQIHYFTYTITKEEEGQPVRAVLYGGMELSTRKIRSLKKMPDGILLDGRPVTVREIVAAGQRLQIRMEDDAVSVLLPVGDAVPSRGQGGAAEDMRTVATHGEKERCRDGYLRILYEDADLLFVNKPRPAWSATPQKGTGVTVSTTRSVPIMAGPARMPAFTCLAVWTRTPPALSASPKTR